MLGPADYGIYAYCIAMVTLLAMPAALGIPQLLVRQVAAYAYHRDWGLMRGLWRWSNQLVLIAGAAVAALAGLGSWLLAARLPPAGLWVFWLALPLVPLLALGALRVAALRGLHHVVLAQLPEGLLRPGLFLAAAVLAWLVLGPDFGPLSAMVAQTGATLAAFLVGAILLLRLRPAAVRSATPAYRARQWRTSALPMLFVGGVYVINTNADLIMLGWFGAARDVGVYQVATRGAQVVLFVMMAANLTAAPLFSRLFQQQDQRELQRVATLTARMILLFAVPLALLLILFGGPLLGLVFGPAYVAGATALALLAAGQLVNAGSGSAAELLLMTGFERLYAKVAAFGVAVNIGLNLALIPVWGIEGAATATATSIVIVNFGLALLARRRMGIDVTALGWTPATNKSSRL